MALGTGAAGSRTARASHHGTSLVTLRGKPEYHALIRGPPGRDDSAALLAASTEEIHYSVHHLADVNRAFVAAGLGRWDQRPDLDPLLVTEIYECKNQLVTSD
jgi:hypothetical protein